MTDILARIIVRETHGIRRFLYPLKAEILLSVDLDYAALGIATRDNDIDLSRLRLITSNGEIPIQVEHITRTETQDSFRIDFAISLAPYTEEDLYLVPGIPASSLLADPLSLTRDGQGNIHNAQQRFALTVSSTSMLDSVVYDGVEHMREPSMILYNGTPAVYAFGRSSPIQSTLHWRTGYTWSHFEGRFEGKVICTSTALTACKSWVRMMHIRQQPRAGDVVTFTLPLTVSDLPLLCDFGVGGGIYSKIGADNTVIWNTEFNEGSVQWTLATNGRTDYAGEVGSREEYHAQQWFHVIDKGKALAVAITHMPETCRTLTVTLNSTGDVQITFTLEKNVDGLAEFGVCYHFLNDAPAIAAATNPQSILLPPTVEVLPV